jgi:hypothetical protein
MFAHVLFRCLFLGQRDPLILMRQANTEFHDPLNTTIYHWNSIKDMAGSLQHETERYIHPDHVVR